MGWNTTVIVLNDALGNIAEDPDFGKKLADAVQQAPMNRGKRIGVSAHSKRGGIHIDAASVIESHHADGTAVVAVGGNCATVLGEVYTRSHHKPEDKIELLRALAEREGYSLRKKPARGKRGVTNKGA